MVSLSLRGSLGLPLAVVHTVAKTVVAKTIAVSPQSAIQKVRSSLSLGGSLSLSLPLAIVVASVAKTVAVAKTIAVAKISVVGIAFASASGRKSENYEQFH